MSLVMAAAILRAAAESPQALHDRIEIIRRQLTVAMFAAGAPNVPTLKNTLLLRI